MESHCFVVTFRHDDLVVYHGRLYGVENASFHLDCVFAEVPLHNGLVDRKSSSCESVARSGFQYTPAQIEGSILPVVATVNKVGSQICSLFIFMVISHGYNHNRPSKRSSIAFFFAFFFFVGASIFTLTLSLRLGTDEAAIILDSSLAERVGFRTVPVRETGSPVSSLEVLALSGLSSFDNSSLRSQSFVSGVIPVTFIRRDKVAIRTVPSAEN